MTSDKPPFNPFDTERPLFLDPAAAAAQPYPGSDEVPIFDCELPPPLGAPLAGAGSPEAPSRGIITRYREIARMHALGSTNNEICRALGYTASRLSIVLKDPFVQAEISRWRDELFEADAVKILKETSRDAALRLRHFVTSPGVKDQIALDASKFAIEKTHGKARQEVSVESNSLSAYSEVLREMMKRGEALGGGEAREVREIASSESEEAVPGSGSGADPMGEWIKTNL